MISKYLCDNNISAKVSVAFVCFIWLKDQAAFYLETVLYLHVRDKMKILIFFFRVTIVAFLQKIEDVYRICFVQTRLEW